MTMAYSSTVSGARASFKITTPSGEQKVAFASSVSYTINHGHTPVDVIDQLEPKEYAPTSYTVSVSCSGFRIPGHSAISDGFQQKLQDILDQPDLKLAIYDRGSDDEALLVVDKVKFVSRSGGVGARSLWTESYEFVGIVAYDEAGPAVTSNNNTD